MAKRFDEAGADVGNCSRLTSFRFAAADETADIRVRTLSGHPLLEGVAPGTVYGMRVHEKERAPLFVRYPQRRGVSPILWCDDPEATALGVLEPSELPGP